VVPSFDVDMARRQIGTLVLYVLLPALNVSVIYGATFDRHLWQVPAVMLGGVIVCVICAVLVFKPFALDRRVKNSLILGSAFGNVTYLGLPLLRGLFPQAVSRVTEVAIICEITVTSANLVTATVLAARDDNSRPLRSFRAALVQIVRFPLIWTVALTALIRILGIPLPSFVLKAAQLMGESAPGLMLLVLGMAIKPAMLATSFRRFGTWWPMLVIKLALLPLVVFGAGSALGLSALDLHATTIEAAMPPQMFVLIVADRLRFDTEVLAPAVALLTVISFFTLPVLHHLLA
jgi:predicted permease